MTGLVHARRIATNSARLMMPSEEEPGGVSIKLTDQVASFFVSATVHAGLLLLLAIFVFHQTNEVQPPVDVLDASIDSAAETETVAEAKISVMEKEEAGKSSEASQIQNAVKQLTNASAPPLVALTAFKNPSLVSTRMPQDKSAGKPGLMPVLGKESVPESLRATARGEMATAMERKSKQKGKWASSEPRTKAIRSCSSWIVPAA